MKRIIIVANSEFVSDINYKIEDTDIIVRFNSPSTDNLIKTGKRTDFLFIANTFNLYEPIFTKNTVLTYYALINKKLSIIMPYSDEIIDMINPYFVKKTNQKFFFIKYRSKEKIKNSLNHKLESFLFKLNFTNIKTLNTDDYLQIKNKLNTTKVVSTGLIAIDFFLNNPDYKNYKIFLNGFTNKGWHGHDWDQERIYIKDLISNELIYQCNEL